MLRPLRRIVDHLLIQIPAGLAIWSVGIPLAAVVWKGAADFARAEASWRDAVSFQADYVGMVVNSLLIAAGAALGALAAGGAAGMALAAPGRLPGRRLFCLLAFLPYWIPGYVAAIAAIEWFGRNGILARLLRGLGVLEEFPSFIYTVSGVVLILTFSMIPFVALPFAAALRAQDRELLEAAWLEGDSRQVWWRLRVPLASPAAVTGALVVFFLAIVEFAVPEQLQVSTCVVEVYIQFSAFYSAAGAVAVVAPVATIGAVAVLVLLWKVPVLARGERGFGDAWIGQRTHLEPTGRLNGLGFAVCVVVLGVPVAGLMAFLLRAAGGLGAIGSTLWMVKRELSVSVLWSATASLTAVAVAGGLAVRLYAQPRSFVRLLLGVAAATLAIPGVLYGFGIVVFYNQPAVSSLRAVAGSPVILSIAYLVRAIPIALLVTVPLFRSVSRDLWEAARLEGGERGSAGWRLLWLPQTGWKLLILSLLLFVLNMQELGAPLIVQPPGATPLIVRLFSLIHFGFDRHVAALCLILAGLCALTATGAWVLWTFRRRLECGSM